MLDVELLDGFEPQVGKVFDLMTYDGVTGFFDEFAGLDTVPGVFLLPLVLPDRFRLQTVLHGDANLDAVVNALDANIIAVNFMQSGLGYTSGDVNLDGIVDALDANILALNFQAGTPAAPIPEPASLWLAAAAVFALSFRRRSRA